MDVVSELVREGAASTGDSGPRRSSRKAKPKNRVSMSTGGSTRIGPLAAPPKASTSVFDDPVQEELPAITINQWKPPASQSKVKKDPPRRCTFCQSRRQKCVPQGPDSCQACVRRGLECRDWREAKDSKSKGKQKANEKGKKNTRTPRSSNRSSAPQQSGMREALLQSFRAGPTAVETAEEHSSNPSVQPHRHASWATDQQNAVKTTTRLGLSQRHTDTSHSKIRRVTFDIPSERSLLTSSEVDADVEMATAQNTRTPAERAMSFEIVTEAEYQAALKSQHHASEVTFKREPTDDNNNVGLRMDNVGCFLRSLGLEHWISNFHNIGLKSRDHLRKLVEKVNDKERMDELWRLLQSQKVPIAVWWDVLDGLSKVAANHHL